MIYGFTQFLKSILFGSFLVIGIFSLLKQYFMINISNHNLYLILSLLFIERLIYYIQNWKYIIMPYALNLSKKAKDENLLVDFFIDKLVSIKHNKAKDLKTKIICKDLNSFTIEYKNLISLDIDNYKNASDQIIHYLGLFQSKYEIRIYPTKNKNVILSFYKLPLKYDIDIGLFKKDKIFLGIYEKGLYYRDINNLDHMLCIGESGSGKSNFMQLLNLNILINYHKFKKIYMIDLKGGVELNRYKNIKEINIVSDIEQLNISLDLIVEDLQNTQKEMIQKNIRKLDDYIVIIFDEFGSISTHHDKKVISQIFSKLALISMQGRASGILLFMFGQKIDTTILPSSITNNLQSKMLGKTSNDYSINIIDLKENIRKNITWVEIQDFNTGRFIFKDGHTSKKDLIQVPFISNQFLDYIINMNLDYYHYLSSKL
jgi:S-DNA-T family DNA segregation ATPase FtsK/SpoIIIE